MKLHTSGEAYLKAIYILIKERGTVALWMLLNAWEFQSPASATQSSCCTKVVFLEQVAAVFAELLLTEQSILFSVSKSISIILVNLKTNLPKR